MLVACVIYPWLVLPLSAIVALFLFLDVIMNKGILEARQIENVSKSQVLHHLTSTTAGANVIRAYRRQHIFQQKFNEALNAHLSAQNIFRYSNRWFVFRMDLLGLTTIALTAAFAVAARGVITPAVAGLALANVFQVRTQVP
jgi:ABC-type multidrug transport system fused ATPase/permease subunit